MRRSLIQMASSIWMPEPTNCVRTAASRQSSQHLLTHPVMRVRPMPEQMISGHMNVIQYSADGIPSSICRPADGS